MNTPQQHIDLYKQKTGSEHIASVLALEVIDDLIDKDDFNLIFCDGSGAYIPVVLEFGAGIGTITTFLLDRGVFVMAYEDDKFCLKELQKIDNKMLYIAKDTTFIPDHHFNLIICDGSGAYMPKKIVESCTFDYVLFEGHRFLWKWNFLFAISGGTYKEYSNGKDKPCYLLTIGKGSRIKIFFQLFTEQQRKHGFKKTLRFCIRALLGKIKEKDEAVS